MKNKPPQWQVLYWSMQKGRRLTMLDLFKLTGSLNGHKRIRDIEKHTGKMVYRDWKPGKRKVREFFMRGNYR